MKHKTPLFLLISFILTLSIFAGLMTYTLNQFNEVRIKSASIVDTNNTKIDLINTMHIAAKNRLLNMLVMANIDDPFKQDEVFMDFNLQGSVFTEARQKLKQLPLSDKEQRLINEQGKKSNFSVPIQREVVDFIQQGDRKSAIALLNEKGIEAQNDNLATLEQLVELQRKSTEQILEEIEHQHQESVSLVFTWSFFAFIFGSILAYIVFSKITRSEKQLSHINNELEQRVAKRTQDLQTTNDKLTSTISNLEKAQSQLIESEKLASLGGLVAGIAHEVNTPLGIGLTSSSFLREKVDQLNTQVAEKQLTQSGLNAFIDEANQTCMILENNLYKAADLITNFKQLAVDQSSDQNYTFNVYDTLQATAVSLNHILKKQHIQTNIECSTSLKMYGNSGILSQIITNLLTNSVNHAFDKNSQDKQIHIKAEPASKKLVVEYADNGIGMPEEVVKKIYEPFFTTKRGKGGSGLGMNLVYNLVVQKLKGNIDIKTAPGEGTSFTIEIPFDNEQLKQA